MRDTWPQGLRQEGRDTESRRESRSFGEGGKREGGRKQVEEQKKKSGRGEKEWKKREKRWVNPSCLAVLDSGSGNGGERDDKTGSRGKRARRSTDGGAWGRSLRQLPARKT